MRLSVTSKVALSSVLALALAGCPDTGSGPDARIRNDACVGAVCTPDADLTPPIDAGPPDAGPPMTTHTGTVSLQEVRLLGAGAALGSGLLFSADFPPVTARMPDVAEGSLTNGCTAWLYDVATGDVPAVGGDEGPITVAGTTAHMPQPNPGPPPAGCVFVPGRGYTCLDGAGAGDTTITPIPMSGGAALVNVAGATALATDPGHYISLAGLTNATNNGAFPVVAIQGTGWVIGNPGAVAEAATAAVTYQLIAGAGPVPGMPSPEAIADGDMVTIGIIPGGTMDIDFPDTAPIASGNAFAPNAATIALMQAIPVDAAAPITLSCAGDPGCGAGSAGGTIVVIQTTDAPIPGMAPPYYFPAATGKMGYIQCRAIATDTITISAAVQAVLMNSGATRIRTSFFRDGFALTGNPDGTNGTNIVVGHGVLGFTNP